MVFVIAIATGLACQYHSAAHCCPEMVPCWRQVDPREWIVEDACKAMIPVIPVCNTPKGWACRCVFKSDAIQ